MRFHVNPEVFMNYFHPICSFYLLSSFLCHNESLSWILLHTKSLCYTLPHPKEAVTKVLDWPVLPLCYFSFYFVILCDSILYLLQRRDMKGSRRAERTFDTASLNSLLSGSYPLLFQEKGAGGWGKNAGKECRGWGKNTGELGPWNSEGYRRSVKQLTKWQGGVHLSSMWFDKV